MSSIFIAMPDGLLRLRKHQGRWSVQRVLEGAHAQCLASDPLRPEDIYCGTFDSGLWRSADAGTTWEPVGAGIASEQIMAVAVSRNERVAGRGVVYAGTEPSHLYRSTDGGARWQELAGLRSLPSSSQWSFPPRPYTNHVRAIALDPNAAGHLAVAIEAGALVRSDDAGQTWRDRTGDGPRDSHTLAMPRNALGWLYSAAGDGFMHPGRGFAVSKDGGETWERPDEGLHYHYGWGIAVDPVDPETLLLSVAPGPREAHDPQRAESAIYRKRGNAPWQQVTDGLPETRGMLASVLASEEEEPGVFYAVNNSGLFCSADGGLRWSWVDVEWPGQGVARPADLLVSTAGGPSSPRAPAIRVARPADLLVSTAE